MIRFHNHQCKRGFPVTFHLNEEHKAKWTRIVGISIFGWFIGAIKGKVHPNQVSEADRYTTGVKQVNTIPDDQREMLLLSERHLRFMEWMICDYEEHNKAKMTPDEWAKYFYEGLNDHFKGSTPAREMMMNTYLPPTLQTMVSDCKI